MSESHVSYSFVGPKTRAQAQNGGEGPARDPRPAAILGTGPGPRPRDIIKQWTEYETCDSDICHETHICSIWCSYIVQLWSSLWTLQTNARDVLVLNRKSKLFDAVERMSKYIVIISIQRYVFLFTTYNYLYTEICSYFDQNNNNNCFYTEIYISFDKIYDVLCSFRNALCSHRSALCPLRNVLNWKSR